MRLLIRNIGAIVGSEVTPVRCKKGVMMADAGIIPDAWLLVVDDKIDSFGSTASCGTGSDTFQPDNVIDAQGGWLFPSFCDSHTHIVYAGSREHEFADKIKGLSYEQIAANGGGILNSADLLRKTSEDELFRQSMKRVEEVMADGSGCIEIKSGYGLSTESELKMLRVIRRISETVPARIKATFLGAHAVAREYAGRQEQYVDLICNEMIPEVAKEGLADFIDVFCDKGFFTPEETSKMLETALNYGLKPKIHADELASSGGTAAGVSHNALSVDHLERAGKPEIELLKNSCTIPTLLPGASFFLNMPYAPAREMIDNGLPVALASDYNPGSSPSGNMRFVASLGCIKMKMTAAEAINAVTVNGACAMDESLQYGSIAKGKIANFFITAPLPSLDFFPYAYSTPLIKKIFLRGKEWNRNHCN